MNEEVYVGISKAFMPWKVFFTEAHPIYSSVPVREKYFKNASGKRYLKKILEDEGSQCDAVKRAFLLRATTKQTIIA